MSFIETVRRAGDLLQQQGRISLRGLKLEFGLDDESLEGLVEELVDVQQVAAREGKVLSWIAPAPSEARAEDAETPAAAGERRARNPRDYTPKHLADKILQCKSALEGERKQVTVLFADVKGSTQLAEQLDPEEWHALLDRFFQILTEGVHRFEGTVNQYTGDGIMALFGAPIAHEDHAQRACYAALQARDELRQYADELGRTQGLSLLTRMGLHSGEVVVGKIGDDLRMDYTAQGQVVNLAQRMEQLAQPGGVCLSQQSADLVSGYFQLGELGPARVKGLRDPIPVYELEGVGELRSRFDVSRVRGLSGFVGREREIAQLEAALERAWRGSLQLVGVVAEAGTGKSRLLHEFGEHCRSRSVRLVQAGCPPHGTATPLAFHMNGLRSYLGISERDTLETARTRITAQMSELELEADVPFLLDLIGIDESSASGAPHDPDARQREFLRIIRRINDRLTEPYVALYEDLHWIDSASEGVYVEINRIELEEPVLHVLSFRPEYRPPQADWSNYEEIRLKPLTSESIADLLRDLLGPEASGQGLQPLIQERAAGNPFFVEEIVQSLAESGHLHGVRGAYQLAGSPDAIDVPDSVQTVLAARIDRLDEHAKQVLQAAAVIGTEFPVQLLEAAVALPARDLDPVLHELVSGAFLFQQEAYPEVEYAFQHPLTQQVAYESQLRGPRRHAHGTVARLLEERYPDRLGEKAALIAHHWDEAGQGLEAARWYRRAAEWMSVRDVGEAFSLWRSLCNVLEGVAESRERSELRLAGLLQILNLALRLGLSLEEAASAFTESRELATALDDPWSLGLAFNTYGVLLTFEARLSESLEHCEKASRSADRADDVGLRLLARMDEAHTLFQLGQLERAMEVCEGALRETPEDLTVGRAIRGFSPYIQLVSFRGQFAAILGHLPEARGDLERSLELALEHGDVELPGWNRFRLADWACFAGDPEAGLRHARFALENAEQTGSRLTAALGYRCLGNAHIARGAWDDAVSALVEGLRITREEGVAKIEEPLILAWLADAYLGTGEVDRALATASEAIETSRRMGTRWKEIPAQLSGARALRTRGADDAPEVVTAALRAAEDLVTETGARVYLPHLCEERATLAALLGDEAGRERDLREAHRLYTAMGATGHAQRVARGQDS